MHANLGLLGDRVDSKIKIAPRLAPLLYKVVVDLNTKRRTSLSPVASRVGVELYETERHSRN